MRFLTAGSDGLLVETEDLEQALALFERLQGAALPGCLELVPAARTVMLRFDPLLTDVATLRAGIGALPLGRGTAREGETFEITVVYDGEDLADVAQILKCSVDEVIRRHTAALHTVAFTGFAPGFAYMTSDDPSFDVPRRRSPRVRIPAGSVALAGKFSGIYPAESPGGWQLLGRTPMKMWDLSRARPALLVPGDQVRFRQIHDTAALGAPRVETPSQTRCDAAVVLTVQRADRPALLQDAGRTGHAALGVSRSGALDLASFHAANDMLGNARNAPALEIMFGGITLTCVEPVTLALTGAPCSMLLTSGDGPEIRFQPSASFALDAGDTLAIGAPAQGMVSYLGIRGGFLAEPVMGSASRDSLAGIGPEPVVTGSRLSVGQQARRAVDPLPLPAPQLPASGDIVDIDVIIGPRDDWFTETGLRTLTSQDWRVTPEVSRVGKRLAGPLPLERHDATELPSEPTVPGAIQVPHSGQPVVFLADHPVTGGYPVIAVVARHHLDLMAQVPPGALIRFRSINGDR